MAKRTVPFFSALLVVAALLSACGATAPSAPADSAPAAPTAAVQAAAPTEAAAPTAAAPAPTEAAAPTAAAPAPTEAAPPTPTPVSVSTFDAAAAGDRVVVRWFVGLGTGSKPDQIKPQRDVVEKFNQSQNTIYLALDIVDNNQAYNILATQIASGNAPDIIGPIGLRGRNGFKGQLLDLSDQIKASKVDLSQYDPKLVEFYNIEGQGQIGLPYAIYPSFIYYNKDLFDEAGLPYPPHTFDEQYDGKAWDMQALQDLAMKLTVDANGNDATNASFDAKHITQFGFHPQWVNQARPVGSLFGAASLIAPDGGAQIPANWLKAWEWYHDGMFKYHFMPSDSFVNSDVFGSTNVFNSGHLAMAFTHIWYLNAIDPGKNVKNWDIAVVPSYNGTATAKLHADTFSIMKSTKHPQEAFQALLYLLNDPTLIGTYGAMPAQKDKQADFFKQFDKRFAPNQVDWQVALDSLQHIDNPSHEEDLPNFLKAQDALSTFETALRTQPEMNVDAETAKLKTTLQTIFQEKQ